MIGEDRDSCGELCAADPCSKLQSAETAGIASHRPIRNLL